MKLQTFLPMLLLGGALVFPRLVSGAETAGLLAAFADYEQGKPVAMVAETRQMIFHGTANEAVRAEREADLLRFIASDAKVQAKAIAIEWLGCLGSPASVPGLVAARKTPELVAPVAAALERIPGPEAQRARLAVKLDKPVIGPSAAAVARFSEALAADSNSPSADALLLEALRSDNSLLTGNAMRRIREGAGSPALASKVIDALPQLPSVLQPKLCDALSTCSDSADVLRPVLLARVGAGDSTALPALGRILRPADVPSVLELVAGDAPEMRDAARTAFLRAADAGINPVLIRMATEPGNPHAAPAIGILADRAASEAVDPLWALVGKNDSALALAALKALGSLVRPDDLPGWLAKYAAASAGPLAGDFSKCVWDVVRRHPDPASAADLLEKAAADSPEQAKETLIRYANRIRPKTGARNEIKLELPQQDDRPILSPNGCEEVVYLNCGSFAEANGGKVTIRRVSGKDHRFGSVAHPLATVDFGKEIAYEITGLDPSADYVIGFSAWDADLGKRRETLLVDDMAVLSDFAPLAFHAGKPTYTRIHLPLPRDATADGNVRLTVKATAGPNAVISELWILRRVAARGKRIVILTGDDHPAHHWRETGPEFAKILRADPRVEVTISESPVLLGSPALFSYDAVFLHFKNYAERLPTQTADWENLASYVRGGGGLVIAHFGCGAMQEWNGFVKTAGRVWDPKKRAHDPYGGFVVRMLETGHPATTGLKDFSTRDELYTCLTGDTDITVLAEATSKIDQSVQPMAFVLTPGKGRVFHSPLGHDLGALEADGVRALYLRGSLWAAGL